MVVEVQKEDIKLIGHTVSNENGYAAFSCKIDTSGIEEILLRNILNCFDEKYIITDAYDAYDRDENKEIIKGSEDIVFVTNMPFDLFMKI